MNIQILHLSITEVTVTIQSWAVVMGVMYIWTEGELMCERGKRGRQRIVWTPSIKTFWKLLCTTAGSL